MIRFFSESNPVNIFLLFITGALIRIPYFVNPEIPELFTDAGYVYSELHNRIFHLSSLYHWLSPAIAYLLLFLQGLALNSFVNSQKLYGSAHSLLLFSYVFFTALIPQWNELTPFLFINTIMILVLPRLIGLFNKRNVQNEIFTLSVMISLCSLIYKPALIYLVLLYIALLILRPFRFSEWILVIIGFLLPYYLILVYCFVWDHWDQAPMLIPLARFHQPVLSRNPSDLLAILFLLIPVFSGLFYIQKYRVRILALQRKIWAFNFYYLLIGIILFLFIPNNGYDNLLLSFLPAAFYIAAFFHFAPVRFYTNMFAWLTLGFLLVRNFL